jgi:hypothetical protein
MNPSFAEGVELASSNREFQHRAEGEHLIDNNLDLPKDRVLIS